MNGTRPFTQGGWLEALLRSWVVNVKWLRWRRWRWRWRAEVRQRICKNTGNKSTCKGSRLCRTTWHGQQSCRFSEKPMLFCRSVDPKTVSHRFYLLWSLRHLVITTVRMNTKHTKNTKRNPCGRCSLYADNAASCKIHLALRQRQVIRISWATKCILLL